MLVVTVLGIGALPGFAILARRAEALWGAEQGLVILTQPRRYLREVAAWQLGAWLMRFALVRKCSSMRSISAKSFQTMLLVMSVQAISTMLPFTPGGVRVPTQRCWWRHWAARRATVLSHSVGQQLAVTAWWSVLRSPCGASALKCHQRAGAG